MYTNIEIQIEGKTVFIANDGSSGCKYNFETTEELKKIIFDYVSGLIDYELEENEEE